MRVVFEVEKDKNQKSLQIIKGTAIALFISASIAFYIQGLDDDNTHVGHSGWDDVPKYSLSFGYVMGIYAFSFS